MQITMTTNSDIHHRLTILLNNPPALIPYGNPNNPTSSSWLSTIEANNPLATVDLYEY